MVVCHTWSVQYWLFLQDRDEEVSRVESELAVAKGDRSKLLVELK